MDIAYIDICRLLDLDAKKKHIIDRECDDCNSTKFHIWKTSPNAKCYNCDNEVSLKRIKEDLGIQFSEEHQEIENLMR